METIKKIFKLIFRKINKERSLSLFIIFLISTLILLSFLSDKFLVEISKEGGEINEIIINENPNFINPVLGLSTTDKTLISLIYSPLLRKSQEGELEENIANFELDETGKKYTLNLKDNIFFHDGKKMDIDDVIFTIEQIQDPQNNSFYRPEWINVELAKINDLTLEIKIPAVNHYFKNSLELYILPKHIWENIDYFNLSEENLRPTGSGPFKITELKWDDVQINDKKDKKINSIVLEKNNNYFKGKIFINKIIFNFFDSEEDFLTSNLYNSTKNINIFSYDNLNFDDKFNVNIIEEAIDFNLTIKNKNSNKFLQNKDIRKFIYDVWNSEKEKIESLRKDLLKKTDFTFDKDNTLLKYKKEIISFSTLTGLNQDESLVKISEKLKEKMRIAGIDLDLKNLEEEIFWTKLRDRDFESIISGYKNEEMYWFYYYHSTQKNDPWINIAQFNSLKINTLLVDLKKNLTEENRNKKILELKKELKNYYLLINLEKEKSYYYNSKKINYLNEDEIISGEKRFNNVQNWVLQTERILPFFKD